MTDFHRSQPLRSPPSNIHMEQALLGSLLLNNSVMQEISGSVSSEDFVEEVHRRVFEVATALIADNQLASPITLKTWLADDQLGQGFTTWSYLIYLAAEASAPISAKSHAQGVRDLAVRRALISTADRLAEAAADMPADVRPAAVAAGALDELHAISAKDPGRKTRIEAHTAATESIDYARRVIAGEIKHLRITTGFEDLDRTTDGFVPEFLWIVGARPAMGKTIFSTTSAVKAAKAGHGVLDFSLEVSKAQKIARVLSDMTYSPRAPIEFSRILQGNLAPDEMWSLEEAQARLQAMPLVLDVASRLTPTEIRMRVKAEKDRMARQGNILRVAFIDYLKQVQASDRYRGQRVQEVGEISYALKQIAKDEGICIVLLAQLNRALENREDKRPGLSDLRESGDLEADADVVAFVHRQSYYVEKSAAFDARKPEAIAEWERTKNAVEIIIGKNRAGAVRTVELWCEPSCSTMSDQVGSFR